MHCSLRQNSARVSVDPAESDQRTGETASKRSWKHIGLLFLCCWLALALLALTLAALEWQPAAASRPTAPAANEIAITAAGCERDRLDLPAIRAAQLAVSNSAGEPMVLTFPSLDAMLTVEPGQRAMLELPALPSGSFAFVCLSASSHNALEASAGRGAFVCGLDATLLRRRALTTGTLVVRADPDAR